MDTKKIGQFLAQFRKDQGLTQDELGCKLGVTNKTVLSAKAEKEIPRQRQVITT